VKKLHRYIIIDNINSRVFVIVIGIFVDKYVINIASKIKYIFKSNNISEKYNNVAEYVIDANIK